MKENLINKKLKFKKISEKKSTQVFFGLLLLFTIVVLIVWMFVAGTESTDDAKISGHIVSLASRIEGQVVYVYVENGSHVKEGDPLVLLDNSLQLANVDLAQADFDSSVASFNQAIVNIKESRASFLSAQSAMDLEYKNLNRVLSLQKQNAISQQAVDQQKNKYNQAVASFEGAKAVLYMTENVYKNFGSKISSNEKENILDNIKKVKGLNPTLDIAVAKLQKAKATLDLANLNLSYTTVRAPFSGDIANKTIEVGKNVDPSIPLLSVVSLSDVWVVANFKETQLSRIKEGAQANIKVDTYSGKSFKGVVSSLSPASGDSFALLPADNASGNFIKVTQRFPVKINFRPFPIDVVRPGMSVEVTVKAN